jgi:hypothetical protein
MRFITHAEVKCMITAQRQKEEKWKYTVVSVSYYPWNDVLVEAKLW